MRRQTSLDGNGGHLVSTTLSHVRREDFTEGSDCTEKSQTSRTPKGLKEIPIVLLLTTLGKEARLPCHYCDQRSGITGRIWRRKNLHGAVMEVKLDTHDKESKNRVFVNEAHTLIIRNVSKTDGAYYFCYDTESKDNRTKMEFLLDVGERTALEPNVLNSPVDLNKAVPPLLKSCDGLKSIPSVSQYSCYAEWSPWSNCDVCGKIGKRRKVGECRLQKMAKASIESAKGATVEADFPVVGVGCHSYLLNSVPEAKKLLNRIPNIVLIEKCEVPCEGYLETATEMTAHKIHAFLSKVKIKSISELKGVKHEITSVIKKEKEGATIALFCPGATLDTPVRWKFENKEMNPDKVKEKSHGRVNIDATDALHIRDLRITDSGEYICTLYGVEVGLVRLSVSSVYTLFDPTTNFGILTLFLVLCFFLYLGLLAIKCKSYLLQRKVQKLRQGRGMILPLVASSENESESD